MPNCSALGSDLQQDLAHRPFGQALEGLGQLVEGKDAVHQRAGAAVRKQLDNLLPSGATFAVGVSADGDAAQANAAKEKARRVEFGNGPGEAADDAYLAEVAERVDDLWQQVPADGVNREINPARRQRGFGGLRPLRVGGVECRG